MELRHLRYFTALAEQLNFTRAAEATHVTQSTLSHQIKQLETEIGQRLFDRIGKRIVITDAGEQLLGKVKHALSEIDDGLRALRGAAEQLSGNLRIGVTHTFNISLLPTCIDAFLRKHPSVRVTVHEQSAEAVARALVELIDKVPTDFKFVYPDEMPLWDKIRTIATKIYGAADVTADSKVRAQIKKLQDDGYGRYPICVAKTQYSFSADAGLRGAPSGYMVNVREVRLAAGAEFIVMICGDIMTMPGLPKVPSAEKIDLTDEGKVVGLF